MRIRLLLTATLTASALLAAGCAATEDATGSDTIGTANAINPHARADLREGGNLRLAISAYPPNWNTLQVDGNDAESADTIRPLLPRAFDTDAAGNLTVNHDYFTDVRMTGTDPQTVVYDINPKAVWSDGTPITWEDLASQANSLSGRDKGFLIAINPGFDRVSKVERGENDRQAVLTFDRHYAEWRGQFSGNMMLYPKSVTRDPDSFNKALVDHIGLTAGPFVVESTDRTQGRITLARNPKWWGETPKLDHITVSVLDRSAWVGAIQNNELDATLLAGLDDLQIARSTPGVSIRSAPGNRWRHFTFNGAPGSILEDPALRVAISKAIDRQRIADTIQNGLIAEPKPLNNHVFLRGQQGYQDNALGYDPEAAARELDAIGWTRNGDVRSKDGRELVIRDVMYSDEVWVRIAKLIQEDLAKIGVGLTIDTKPGARFFPDVIQPGDFDVCQFSFVGDVFSLSNLPQVYGLYPGDVQANFGRIGSPELNDLIERTLSELDPAKAIELANQVDQQVFAEGHSLPLIQNEGNYAVRSDLANYGAPGLASYDWTKIGFLK